MKMNLYFEAVIMLLLGITPRMIGFSGPCFYKDIHILRLFLAVSHLLARHLTLFLSY